LEFLSSRDIYDGEAFAVAKGICRKILQDPKVRQARFEKTLSSDFSSAYELDLSSGVYAISYLSSFDLRIREMLLILGSEGNRTAKTYATLLDAETVYRGTWAIAGMTTSCLLQGLSQRGRRDICSIYMSAAGGRASDFEVCPGFLSGTSTAERAPIVVRLIGIKLPAQYVSPHLPRIGDENDSAIREALRSCHAMSSRSRDDTELLVDALRFEGSVTMPHEIVSRIRARDPRDLVSPGLLEFCKTYKA
jgi:hypothetical protein